MGGLQGGSLVTGSFPRVHWPWPLARVRHMADPNDRPALTNADTFSEGSRDRASLPLHIKRHLLVFPTTLPPMLRRQLSPASLWHRTPVCLFCAARSQTRLPQRQSIRHKSERAVPIRKHAVKDKKKSGVKLGEEDEDESEGPRSIKRVMLGDKKKRDKGKNEEREAIAISTLYPSDLKFEAVEVDKPPVPMLSYGLDRVLFNPGVYRLQDPRTQVYNFDPYLEKIMPANEFDFDALSE